MKYKIAVLAGILLAGAGLFLLRITQEPQGLLRSLPFLCIGVGCGCFGHGKGELVSRRALKKNPELQKRLDIERNDERNVAIAARAKAKAYDMGIFLYGALLVVFALMEVALPSLLLLVACYLFLQGYALYYHLKIGKEM